MVTVACFPRGKGMVLWLSVVIWAGTCGGETGNKLDCHDAEGNIVPDGTQFIPDKKDPCQTCHCEDGFSIMCTAVSCSPPACIHKTIEGKCCEFVCLDHSPNGPRTPGHNGTGGTRTIDTGAGGITNLSMRLAASTITSLLVLALLLFMIHKLRQRRLLMTVRRLNSSRRRLEEVDHDRYLPEAPPLGMTVPPYQDPPPPYSPPKPPTNIAPGEPPPPYEAINNNANNNNNTHTGESTLEPPPAYQSRAAHSCVSGATRARREAGQPRPQEYAHPMDAPVSCERTEAGSLDRSQPLTTAGSVEDTRVKEVYRESPAGASHDDLNRHGVVLRPSSNVATSASGNSPKPGQAVSVREPTQSLMNAYRPRCIMKSGSVEIVRQSRSPRNSYCLEGVSAVEAMSQSLDPTLLSRMLSGVQGYAPNSDQSPHNPGSIPPGLTETALTSAPSSNMSTLHDSDPALHVSAMDANERRRRFRLSNLLYSPVESVDTPASPLSPIGPDTHLHNIRSNSVNSDLSWFSVCSETGEPRKSKSNNVIRNDCQYPEGSSIFPNRKPGVTTNTPPRCSSPTFARGDNCTDNTANYLMVTAAGKQESEYHTGNSLHNNSMLNKSSPVRLAACNPVQGRELCMSQCSCESCQFNGNSSGIWEKKDSSRAKNGTNCAKLNNSRREAVSKDSSVVGRSKKAARSSSGSISNKLSPKKAKQRPLGTSYSSSDKDSSDNKTTDRSKGPFSGDDKFREESAASIYQLQDSQSLPGTPARFTQSRGAYNNNRHNNKTDRQNYSSPQRCQRRAHPGSLCSDV